MILRDVYCEECGNEKHDVEMRLGDTQMRGLCDECRYATTFRVMCNGGVGRRYRYHDVGGLEHEDICQYLGAEAHYQDPSTGELSPTRDCNTGVAHNDLPRFQPDAVVEKTARAKFERKHRQGLGRIWSLGARRAQGMSNG